MKTKSKLFQARMFCAVALGIGSSFSLSATAADSADTAPAKTSIPWSQNGAKAGADYKGDGLAVIATAGGARLRCAFQKLEGEATREGLWLTSTVIPPSAQGGIMVSWPSADTASFTLEQAGTLAPRPSWVTNVASITDDGTNKSVTIPPTNSSQFFRLRRP